MTTTAEQTFCSDALFYNFRRKFWQVTALSWTFSLGEGHRGARNFTGGGPPWSPLGTAPGWSNVFAAGVIQ